MDVGVLRDIIIIISGIVVIIAAISVIVLSTIIYTKTQKILKSAHNAAEKIETLAVITSDEIGKPLIQAAGMIQSIVCGINTINKIFKKGDVKK